MIKISAVIIGSIDVDADELKNIAGVETFKVTDKKSCDDCLAKIADNNIVFIIADGREVYFAEKIFSRLGALKIYLVTEAHAADNKNLNDVIIQLPAQNFSHKIFEVACAFNDILNVEGLVKLDFEDVKTLLKNSGKAVSSIGIAAGENAVDNALQNALEGHEIKSAKSVLVNFKMSQDSATMAEISAATEKIQADVSEDAQIIWGVTIDDSLGDKVKVAVIAGKFGA
ncbi:MAG: hypothetical protein IJS81_12990 [Selenomonadaceae bacterium]|nr:hypothetical protein [Selenomonadaceae bacterium]